MPWKKLLGFGGNLDLYVNAGIFKEFFIQIDLLHINVSVKHINGERSGNSWHSCASVLYDKCI